MKRLKKSENGVRSRQPRSTQKSVHHPVRYSEALLRAVLPEVSSGDAPNSDEFDRLMRYVVYLTSPDHPAYLENPLTTDEIAGLEQACREKPDWARLLSDLRGEYNKLIEVFEQSSFGGMPLPVRTPASHSRIMEAVREFFFPPVRTPRFAIVVAAILLAGVAILAGTSALVTPSYYEAATIEPATFSLRGGSTALAAGIDAMQRKNYRAAIEVFQQTIKEKPGSDDALLAGYFNAVIRLAQSRHTTLGLFPGFDQAGVDEGISQLSSVLSRIQTAGAPVMLEEQCRFMLGQAWLMKKNVARARIEFTAVAQLHGPRMEQSASILASLPPK